MTYDELNSNMSFQKQYPDTLGNNFWLKNCKMFIKRSVDYPE